MPPPPSQPAPLPHLPPPGRLHASITAHTATIGIIGLGYVGLPLLATFHRAGFPVLGFDLDPAKIAQLNAGQNYLAHLGPHLIADLLAAAPRRFAATADLARLADCDVIISCVPTPLGRHLEPDLSYVIKSADDAAAVLTPGHPKLIILESSTYPRTTREIFLPRATARGQTLGHDLFLAFSPEREDPGRTDHTTATIPKLVGGLDPASTALATLLYQQAIQTVIPVSSAEVAEAAKLLENIYRAVNIALVNEMKVVLAAMDIDIWEVIDAAKTKPFGFHAFYPGPGLGGHCIPIDPFYLTWKAREYGQPTRFIELAGEINHAMPRYVITKLTEALNARQKPLNGSRILILGLAYKPDIDDVRESPSFELISLLQAAGAHVDYNDPHVPQTHKMRHYGDLQMKSVPLTPRSLASYDAAIIATNHAAYDWSSIAPHPPLILDTRNALRHYPGPRTHILPA